jgi:hypothetical protein
MKKLFLWTFVLTLLCVWAVATADVAPKQVMLRTQLEKTKAQQTNPAANVAEAFEGQDRQLLSAEQPADYLDMLEQMKQEAARNHIPSKPAPGVRLVGGDRCEDATVIPGIPYSDFGNTCDYTNDYDEVCPYTGSTAPDVVYSYTPEADIDVTINLCVGITDYDTKLYVYEDVCQVPDDGQDPYACNDDDCVAPGGQDYVSRITCLSLYAGHTYYIVVDGFGEECGNYTMDVTVCEECVVECPEGAQIEQEPCGDDTNGGCNTDPANPPVEAITLGTPVCGTAWADADFRDTDWFELTFDEVVSLTVTGEAEFPLQLLVIYNADCNNLLYSYTLVDPCVVGQVTVTAGPGAAWVWIGDQAFSGNPCGDDNDDYWFNTSAVNLTGACCVNLVCVETDLYSECQALGGNWYVGETCPEFECPTEPEPGCPIEQPPNAVNGLFADEDWPQYVSDQMLLGSATDLNYVTFWGGYFSLDQNLDPDQFHIVFYDDDGGCPGTQLHHIGPIAADTKAQTGVILFGVHEWVYGVDLTPYAITLPGPGTFHMAIYNSTFDIDDVWFWETGDMDPYNGILGQCWNATSPDGPWNYDPTYDMSWILDCEGGPEPSGACCNVATGECEDDVLFSQCPSGYRFEADVLCEDLDPPCGECPDAKIFIEIQTDAYPEETTWDLYHEDGTFIASGGPYDQETLYQHAFCVDDGCYIFTIYDLYGDGICCLYGDGYYNVYYNDVLICTGGEFGASEVCYVNCAPPTGACCVDDECVETNEEQACLDMGGSWYEGYTCPEFDCDAGKLCAERDNVVYDNGDTDGSNGLSMLSGTGQYRSILDDITVVDEPLTFIDFHQTLLWYSLEPPQATGYDLIVWSDVGGAPGTPLQTLTAILAWEIPTGRVWFSRNEFVVTVLVDEVTLDPGTYWLEMHIIGPENAFAMAMSDDGVGDEIIGQPVWVIYEDMTGLDPVDGFVVFEAYYGLNFCLTGEGGGPDCVYIPGDCNHDGTPIALDDVIAMIGMYRGTVVAPYTCSCPPHGDNFAPTADPDGDCTAFALSDVVREIAAYRGTAVAEGCVDCPGQGPLAPRPDGTSVMPSMKSKVKTIQQGSAD